MRMIRNVHAIASHRNGSGGNPFHVVLFTTREQPVRHMVATVFEEKGNVAVLDSLMTAAGNVAFGENSWRGDDYEPELRAAIAAYEDERTAAWVNTLQAREKESQ